MVDRVHPPLTLLAVHAHPDDESTSTGGILAHYADEGIRTVVVTCTNGELGDGPGGCKPGDVDHDPGLVRSIRLAELDRAGQILGVGHVEVLGYHDSGMLDWDFRHRPDVFCNVPVEAVAARIAATIHRYRPQVVVTYDPEGTYQHPDHVHAAHAAVLAVETTRIPAKLYFKAHGRTYWRHLDEALARAGIARPRPTDDRLRTLEDVERRITTTVDVRHVVDRKRAALHAHVSQLRSSLAAKLPGDLFARAFGVETYIRAQDTTGGPVPETDLFLGVRTG